MSDSTTGNPSFRYSKKVRAQIARVLRCSNKRDERLAVNRSVDAIKRLVALYKLNSTADAAAAPQALRKKSLQHLFGLLKEVEKSIDAEVRDMYPGIDHDHIEWEPDTGKTTSDDTPRNRARDRALAQREQQGRARGTPLGPIVREWIDIIAPKIKNATPRKVGDTTWSGLIQQLAAIYEERTGKLAGPRGDRVDKTKRASFTNRNPFIDFVNLCLQDARRQYSEEAFKKAIARALKERSSQQDKTQKNSK